MISCGDVICEIPQGLREEENRREGHDPFRGVTRNMGSQCC